jgi:hypothetical protein
MPIQIALTATHELAINVGRLGPNLSANRPVINWVTAAMVRLTAE